MAKYDLYIIPDVFGFLIDVQSDFIDRINTRMVIPLYGRSQVNVLIRGINPVVNVEGSEYVLMTQLMSSVTVKELGPPVLRLGNVRDEVTRALDRLLHDF